MSLLQRLLPYCCHICGLYKPRHHGLCSPCFSALPWVNRNACSKCALPLPATSSTSIKTCGQCQSHPPDYDTIITPFYYQQPATWLITTFKFNHHFLVGKHLADMMMPSLQQYYMQQSHPELILPVPLHARRLHWRGFNQAILLGKQLSRHLSIPMHTNALQRTKFTSPQQGLAKKHRSKNVHHAFEIRHLPPVQSVALVDDVVTTGATVNELSTLLKKAGVGRVDVWCCARTPKE